MNAPAVLLSLFSDPLGGCLPWLTLGVPPEGWRGARPYPAEDPRLRNAIAYP